MEANYSIAPEKVAAGEESLLTKLDRILSSSPEDGYNIAKEEYKYFFDPTVIRDKKYHYLINKPKFLLSLIQVCMGTELTADERVCCNSMTYNGLSENSKDNYLIMLYYYLAMVANPGITNIITKCGVPQELSAYLAMCRRSSFEPRVNAGRLNFSIICLGSRMMTVQRIADIYAGICNSVEDISVLFNAIMVDTYDFGTLEWSTPDIVEAYANMNNAILSIIDSLPPKQIEYVLIGYNDMIETKFYVDKEVRFSLKDISAKLFPNLTFMYNYFISKGIYLI